MPEKFRHIVGGDEPPDPPGYYRAWKSHGTGFKRTRVKILDSAGRKSKPRYNQIDPFLLDPYTLLLLLPNRAYMVTGSNLTELDDLLAEETVVYIQAYVPGMFKEKPANEPVINVTMHWLEDKAPEQFFKEIMAERTKKQVLETVS